jgi:hypothetical protein
MKIEIGWSKNKSSGLYRAKLGYEAKMKEREETVVVEICIEA